jgi:general secretion pathway protein G
MVVIVILSILAVYMAPKLIGRDDQARQLRAKVDIEALETALKIYRLGYRELSHHSTGSRSADHTA